MSNTFPDNFTPADEEEAFDALTRSIRSSAGGHRMSEPTDALAALLAECPHLYTTDDYGATEPGDLESAKYHREGAMWLHQRGVVVLPPDHPLRTGEPSEAMIEAAKKEIDWLVDLAFAKGTMRASRPRIVRENADCVLRAALAVLRETP